jgi:hypothetical protein
MLLVIGVLLAFVLAVAFVINLEIQRRRPDFVPPLPSYRLLRRAVISQMKMYPMAKSAIDIGGGWGGMAKAIGRSFPKMSVCGVEKRFWVSVWSRLSLFFTGPKNVVLTRGDAIEFLKKSDGFDIGIVYLMPAVMKRVEEASDKCRVLLVLDFPLPNRTPTKIIPLYRGFLLGRHRLFVYEIRAWMPAVPRQ